MEFVESFAQSYLGKFFSFIPEVVNAAIVLIIGLIIIRFLKRLAARVFLEQRIDPTFSSFILDALIWGMRILLFVIIASKLGIQTSSFVAMLGAITLAIGLSLQGSLSNFAGGVLIVLFKPFKLGDKIEAQGERGKVTGIHIFSTQIVTEQNTTVYIPNGILSNGKVTNMTQNNLRKTDLIVSTTLIKSTVEFKKNVLLAIDKNDLIMSQPKAKILVSDLQEGKITYRIQAWTNKENYTQVCSDILSIAKEVSDTL